MMQSLIDPSLIGIWLLPGQSQTYEITGDGSYYIAEPDEPMLFQDEGAQMIWGGRRYTRIMGHGETPVGTWKEDATGEGWDFTADHAYSILSATGETFTGIWALRNNDTSLWTCEKQADLETDGNQLAFLTPGGERLTYGYSVKEGIMSLLAPDSWRELTRYVSAERIRHAASG